MLHDDPYDFIVLGVMLVFFVVAAPEGMRDYIASALKGQRDGHMMPWVVRDAASGAVIGSTRYHDYNEAASEVEVGWTFLTRDYWGGAYNQEMKRLMLDHAFQFVEHVVFLVGPTNFRSQRAMEKIGGTRAGTRTNGAGRESVMFVINRRAVLE